MAAGGEGATGGTGARAQGGRGAELVSAEAGGSTAERPGGEGRGEEEASSSPTCRRGVLWVVAARGGGS